ncbi:hypothetical protein EHS39_28880 [Ensifer sp. MPMI2T]|nr:hypothetical protein EHS39_28880 [Ensifer sp. MPMI2T]
MLDRPIQAAAKGLPKNRCVTSSDLLAIADRLAVVANLNDAVFMAAASIDEPRHCDAMQALSMQISKDLASLRDRVEDLREVLK